MGDERAWKINKKPTPNVVVLARVFTSTALHWAYIYTLSRINLSLLTRVSITCPNTVRYIAGATVSVVFQERYLREGRSPAGPRGGLGVASSPRRKDVAGGRSNALHSCRYDNILRRRPRSARRGLRLGKGGCIGKKMKKNIIDADHLLKRRSTCGEETSPFIVYVSFRVYRWCSVRAVEAVEARGISRPWRRRWRRRRRWHSRPRRRVKCDCAAIIDSVLRTTNTGRHYYLPRARQRRGGSRTHTHTPAASNRRGENIYTLFFFSPLS